MEWPIIFLLLLPIVAFLYASVGHGGASGYLALMALFSFPSSTMKPTALLLNLFVAGLSFYHYWKGGHFRSKLFWPFALASVPLSFMGGMIVVDVANYKKILGILLLFAVIRLLWSPSENTQNKHPLFWQSALAGGSIGFFSGLIGIGGGIVLSPLLVLMRWANMKEAAAISALFIWANSAAGLGGQLLLGIRLNAEAFLLAGIALVGGYFGAKMGSGRFNDYRLRILLAVVLLLASGKLFWA